MGQHIIYEKINERKSKTRENERTLTKTALVEEIQTY